MSMTKTHKRITEQIKWLKEAMPDVLQISKAADTIRKLDNVAIAARAFADNSICLYPECMHKICVLNRAFATLDKGE